MKQSHPEQHGIAVKKHHGQNFLRETWVLDRILTHAKIPQGASVVEIGCGDGALTRALLTTPLKQLRVYEIDPEWAHYVQIRVKDPRLTIKQEDILRISLTAELAADAPWMLVANLPYHLTFAILHLLAANPSLITGGIFMVQEEVAQRLASKGGRSMGYVSLFFQHLWEITLHEKIGPGAFFPPPKVNSRLVEFHVRSKLDSIPDEADFWKFIKACFAQPRRTLRNNLATYHYDLSRIDETLLQLRAQQMNKEQFLAIWQLLNQSSPAS